MPPVSLSLVHWLWVEDKNPVGKRDRQTAADWFAVLGTSMNFRAAVERTCRLAHCLATQTEYIIIYYSNSHESGNRHGMLSATLKRMKHNKMACTTEPVLIYGIKD